MVYIKDIMSKTYTETSPPREGEPAGTKIYNNNNNDEEKFGDEQDEPPLLGVVTSILWPGQIKVAIAA